LIFAFTIGDLSTAQVLAPPGMATLATQFSANASTVAFAAAAPYAAVLMGLALVATYVVMSRYARLRAVERR
jgi:iron(III) transport system permease protein